MKLERVTEAFVTKYASAFVSGHRSPRLLKLQTSAELPFTDSNTTLQGHTNGVSLTSTDIPPHGYSTLEYLPRNVKVASKTK